MQLNSIIFWVLHKHTNMHTRTRACVYVRACVRACKRACMHAHTHACTSWPVHNTRRLCLRWACSFTYSMFWGSFLTLSSLKGWSHWTNVINSLKYAWTMLTISCISYYFSFPSIVSCMRHYVRSQRSIYG